MKNNINNHEEKLCSNVVSKFNEGDLLGKNTKLMNDGVTYQIRIGCVLRVQFIIENGSKCITKILKKGNHKSSH